MSKSWGVWLVLLLLSGWAQATPAFTNAGLDGYSGTLDCRYLITGGCNGAAGTSSGYNMLGTRSYTPSSATSALTDPLRGTASTAAYASATTYLPELHAYASSNGNYAPALGNANPALYTGAWSAFADANAWGVQGYQYDGATPFDLTVSITLDSIFSAALTPTRLGHSSFQVAIFGTDNFSFTRDGYCPTLLSSAIFCPGITTFARADNILYDTGSVSATLHYLVAPGARFYVGAFLDANVCCGQTVDSSHTLTMAFNDPTQLSSIAVAGVLPVAEVDEPPGLPLVLLGTAVLVLWMRRWPPKPGR